ncbi:MAG TPA: hypothetical protein VMT27_05030 [Actinomycetes bacterium]|nr:hypothetical protein [Actinomycetes bacterium]
MSRLPGLAQALIDDASVFPPGNAPLAAAVAEHVAYRDSRYEPVIGPLLVPASAVETLRTLADPVQPLSIGLIADTGLAGATAARDALQDDTWIELVHVELRLPHDEGDNPATATRNFLDGLTFTAPSYLEVPAGTDPRPALQVLADDGAERAKLRCGPVDVPPAASVAGFIHECARLKVSFKLTAGLHHALPYEDADNGITQHGFVNTLAATWAAIDGAEVDTLTSLLSTRNPDILLSVLDAADVAGLRSIYRSFGSCSIIEPYDELVDLRLIDEEQ